jgi:regulator of RNase E activity RraA
MRHPNPSKIAAALVAASFLAVSAYGQMFTLTREQMIKYTAQNPYDRFPDGRPKVPDDLLAKVKGLSAEEVLGIARSGYPSQYADGLQVLHPGKKLVGRAVTLQLMPTRPDVAGVLQNDWRAQGNQTTLNHQSAIDLLQPGDVFVVDCFGSIASGGIIGDNLAYYISKKTGAGFVIDGAIRDIEGIAEIDMSGYFRGFTPPAIQGVMVLGINTPVRIGKTTVMPGDVVLGDREGVFFIPPQLVKEVVDAADITHVHDEWTRKKFDEGKYKSTDIYSRPTNPALIKEYEDYLKQKLGDKGFQEYQRQQQQTPAAPARKQ